MNVLKRRLFVGFAIVAVPVGLASAAFACQVLATLAVNPTAGARGTKVTATGGNYSASSSASDVKIHLDSREGRVLATTRAASSGSISVDFTIPSEVTVGYHTLVATQFNANGTPKSGTPGRASFQVTASRAATANATGRPSSGEIAVPGVRSVQSLYGRAVKHDGGRAGSSALPPALAAAIGLGALGTIGLVTLRKRRSSPSSA
jgi:hypothetical protein